MRFMKCCMHSLNYIVNSICIASGIGFIVKGSSVRDLKTPNSNLVEYSDCNRFLIVSTDFQSELPIAK